MLMYQPIRVYLDLPWTIINPSTKGFQFREARGAGKDLKGNDLGGQDVKK